METQQTVAKVSNATLKTIFDRRAVRKYLPQMVEDDLLEQILDAGRMAPSAMNGQSWKYYIVTHRDTISAFSREIAKVVPKILFKLAIRHPLVTLKSLLHTSLDMIRPTEEDHIFHSAPVVIFITSLKDNEWGGLETGMSAQNMMLAAKSLGLDSCPVGLAKFISQTPIYHSLEVPDSEVVQLAVVLGYAAEKPKAEPRVQHTTVFIDRKECC